MNNSRNKACAVVSVDGLSVMDGKEASVNDTGYIVEAYSSTTINGWRRGNHEVASFHIDDKKSSYVSKKDGTSKNCGVIGVVLYPEKILMPKLKDIPNLLRREVYRGVQGQSCGRNCNTELLSVSSQEAGTGYGENKADYVSSVVFDRDESRKTMVVLYYDTIESLRNKGVPIDTHIGIPQPFPANGEELYCPKP